MKGGEMGDVITWTAMVGAVAAIGLAGRACYVVGRLSGKVDNGLTGSVAELRREVKEGFRNLVDKLPCLQPHCPSEEPKHGE